MYEKITMCVPTASSPCTPAVTIKTWRVGRARAERQRADRIRAAVGLDGREHLDSRQRIERGAARELLDRRELGERPGGHARGANVTR